MEKALSEAYSQQKDMCALHFQQRGRHRIFEELNESIIEVRGMMDPCQPIVSVVPNDLSLPEVLQSLVSSSKSMGLQIDFHRDESFPPLLLPLETALHKLVQEILSHALQYAPTAPISLHLTVVDNTVQLTLSFSDALLAPLFSQSTGQAVIFCMKEWVGELGGSCAFRRKVECEVEICANLPLLLRERYERCEPESYDTGYLE